MSLGLPNKVVEFLRQNPEQKFTAQEIAAWIFKTYPNECRQKQERSKATVKPLITDAALIQQIGAEIGARLELTQKKEPKIKTTDEYPRKYYYTESTDNAETNK